MTMRTRASRSTTAGRSTASATVKTEDPRDEKAKIDPVFEMVVLGSGGGPLETDCSGYLLKPFKTEWDRGFLALEGGSGLGALVNLLSHQDASQLFPSLKIPSSHNTPVLAAAYIFSFLTCYLITHAHLDHVLSLIMLTGSVPPRIHPSPQSQPPLIPSETSSSSEASKPSPGGTIPRPPVYGTRETLERLAAAYGGGLWPELGSWAVQEAAGEGRPELGSLGVRGAVEDVNKSAGVIFSPLVPSREHRPLNPDLPITTLTFPVAHGCTSHGLYESSAIFIRYDPAALTASRDHDGANGPIEPQPATSSHEEGSGGRRREFLFFGDVESEYRGKGDELKDVEGAERAGRMCKEIWQEAAQSWNRGCLAAIFIECSYDSTRPAHLMFGHVSPPGVYHELQKLASMTKLSSAPLPLSGLRVFITHIKESLMPHPSGKTARTLIMEELNELERKGRLGVEFVEVKRGDRIADTEVHSIDVTVI